MPWEPEDQLALRAQTSPSGGLQPIPKQRVDKFVGLFESQTAACRSTLPHGAVLFAAAGCCHTRMRIAGFSALHTMKPEEFMSLLLGRQSRLARRFPHLKWIRREAAPQGAIALAASISGGNGNGHSDDNHIGRGGRTKELAHGFFIVRIRATTEAARATALAAEDAGSVTQDF